MAEKVPGESVARTTWSQQQSPQFYQLTGSSLHVIHLPSFLTFPVSAVVQIKIKCAKKRKLEVKRCTHNIFQNKRI